MAGFRFIFRKHLLFDAKFNSSRNLNLTSLGLSHSSSFTTTSSRVAIFFKYDVATTPITTAATFLPIRHSSTSPSSSSTPPEEPFKRKIRDTLDLSFSDARQAYRSKSTWEILRAYIVFKLCSINYLVEHNDKVRLGFDHA